MQGSGDICIITHEFPPRRGGIATYAEQIATTSARLGAAVEVWAPGNRAEADTESVPWSREYLSIRGSHDWPCRLKLAAVLRRDQRDWKRTTIYLPEPGPIRTWLYARELRLPVPGRLVITLHGSELELMLRFPWRRSRLRRLLARCARIGVVSRYVEQRLLDFEPSAAERCVHVPGAPAEIFHSLADAMPEESIRSILCVGRVHPRKGQLVLMDSMLHLPREVRESIEITLVGPARSKRYLKRINESATASGVRWSHLGPVSEPDLLKCYRNADLLVFPSQRSSHSVEGLGLAILEASAAGLPVIASQTGGTSEALADGETGILVEEGNPRALADALLQCILHPQKATAMGRRGSHWVREQFSWERNVQLLFPEIFPQR